MQAVPVEAGALYVLGHVSRADRPGQRARLQINWMNGRDQLVKASIDVVPAEARWTRHTMMVTAPDGAVTAVVLASVHEDSRVWFDDFSLTRGP